MTTIRLSTKEKARLCKTGGITVAVRPRVGRKGYTVFVTDEKGRSVAKPQHANTKREVGAVVHDMLRMEDKCGAGSHMAERSRHRERTR